jgi:hypothetical protein
MLQCQFNGFDSVIAVGLLVCNSYKLLSLTLSYILFIFTRIQNADDSVLIRKCDVVLKKMPIVLLLFLVKGRNFCRSNV